MNRLELSDRIAGMLVRSRTDSGKSQDYISKHLGVSKRTVQNWEAGDASPNFRIVLEWFDCLGVPMYPYIMEVLYPDKIEGINSGSDIEALRSALHTYVDELDDFHVRELLYILYGDHGSSPTGLLDSMTAYMHLPLLERILITNQIICAYKSMGDLGMLRDDGHVMPSITTLEKCADSALSALVSGKESYTIIRED